MTGSLSSLRAVASWSRVAGSSAADYTVSISTAPTYGDMAPSAQVSGVATISMNNLNANQNACAGASVPLYFHAS